MPIGTERETAESVSGRQTEALRGAPAGSTLFVSITRSHCNPAARHQRAVSEECCLRRAGRLPAVSRAGPPCLAAALLKLRKTVFDCLRQAGGPRSASLCLALLSASRRNCILHSANRQMELQPVINGAATSNKVHKSPQIWWPKVQKLGVPRPFLLRRAGQKCEL